MGVTPDNPLIALLMAWLATLTVLSGLDLIDKKEALECAFFIASLVFTALLLL